ncbi:MAG: methyltransferase [Chitinophagales bacterium]
MNWLRKISSSVARPLTLRYLSKERVYFYHGITLKILPGVFHPGLFFSTKFLLSYLENFDLKNKTLLEPGAGSGLISFIAEKKGATVTATDLSVRALEGLRLNRDALSSQIEIIRSDVFEKIPRQAFDFIIINPPYYPKNVTEEWQMAWNCGEDFEYFSKLFSRLSDYTHPDSKVIMVLSEDCDIFTIRNLAKQHEWNLEERNRKRFWWEWNFIYECFKQY